MLASGTPEREVGAVGVPISCGSGVSMSTTTQPTEGTTDESSLNARAVATLSASECGDCGTIWDEDGHVRSYCPGCGVEL
jgi:hypothetical protein